MKTVKFLFAITLILSTNAILAQKAKKYLPSDSVIHIESGEGDNKKSGDGYFFSFEMTKDKILYSTIIVDKKTINNAAEIKLFFKREKIEGTPYNKDPYVLTFPIEKDYIISANERNVDIVAIPFWAIHQILKKEKIKIHQVFFTKGDLARLKFPINKSDLDQLKRIWEKEIIKYTTPKT